MSEPEIDAYLGIGRKGYGLGWWALALWTSGSTLNILARAQNWGFHLSFGADFKDVKDGYAVAAYGSFGGGILLWFVIAGLIVHSATWGRLARHWPGRIPAAWDSISKNKDGPVPRFLQKVVILVAIVVPLYLQSYCVSKFLAGEAVSAHDRKVGWSHLSWPHDPWTSYVFDGQRTLAYCEFFEPWGTVIAAAISFILAFIAAAQFLWPDSAYARGLARLLRLSPERISRRRS